MSSPIDFEDEELEMELSALREAEEVPEGAFYLALKNALVQLERQTTWN